MNTAGTLVYTGTGENTSKVINLASGTGGATIDQSGTGNLKFTANLTAPGSAGGNAKVLTLKGSTLGTGEIAGAISNSAAGTTVTTSVSKDGTGTWTLSGNNTYTGATVVTAGTLLINGNQTTANGAVSVDSNATLGGIGTIGGATTISTGGILSPGTSPGTLTFSGNLTLANGSKMVFEAGDLVAVNGQLTLTNNWTLQLDSSANWQVGGTTTLFNYNTITASPDLIPTFTDNTGLGGSLSLTNTGSSIVLNGYSVIPEPSTWALLAFSLTTVMVLRRRRQHSI